MGFERAALWGALKVCYGKQSNEMGRLNLVMRESGQQRKLVSAFFRYDA